MKRSSARRNALAGPAPRTAGAPAIGGASRWPTWRVGGAKLLDLYSADKIGAEGFAQEGLAREAREGEERARVDVRQLDEIAERFEEVARLLREIDLERLWEAATAQENRELVEEIVEDVLLFPDHLEVQIAGAPRLNVLLGEVGLKDEVQSVGVGGGI